MHFATVDNIELLINLKRARVVIMEGTIKKLEEFEDQNEYRRTVVVEKIKTEMEIAKLEGKLEKLKPVA